MNEEANADLVREATSVQPDEQRFWRMASPLLGRSGVTRSTMMGFPCLRVEGRFVASYDRATGDLLVKLPAERVEQLIATDQGRVFAPAGRRFREWVAISPVSETDWPEFLVEAVQFVSGSER